MTVREALALICAVLGATALIVAAALAAGLPGSLAAAGLVLLALAVLLGYGETPDPLLVADDTGELGPPPPDPREQRPEGIGQAFR